MAQVIIAIPPQTVQSYMAKEHVQFKGKTLNYNSTPLPSDLARLKYKISYLEPYK